MHADLLRLIERLDAEELVTGAALQITSEVVEAGAYRCGKPHPNLGSNECRGPSAYRSPWLPTGRLRQRGHRLQARGHHGRPP